MNSLEFINKEIAYYDDIYERKLVALDLIKEDSVGGRKLKDEVSFCIERLNHLKQIKAELEIMELIKNGWSGMETTISGKQIMKFQNLKLDDWIELWQRMEECLLKRAVEVKDNE